MPGLSMSMIQSAMLIVSLPSTCKPWVQSKSQSWRISIFPQIEDCGESLLLRWI
jgi:hypothetical protein